MEGEPTRPPPTLEDAATALVRTGSHALEHRAWTDSDRAEARRLQAEGLSWAQIAERVCGDKRYKPTVALNALRNPAHAAMRARAPEDAGNPHG